MEQVVAETEFGESTSSERVHQAYTSLAQCREQNRIEHRHTYLAADGRRMLCIFAAPDAEAVRRMSRIANFPSRVWTASVIAAPASPDAETLPELVIVERAFAAPVTYEEVAGPEERGVWCLEVNRVRYLRSYFSLDRRRMVCLYRAPDAEAVRRVQKQIDAHFDVAWTARELAD